MQLRNLETPEILEIPAGQPWSLKEWETYQLKKFKTISTFNLSSMKEIFTTKSNVRLQPIDIAVESHNTLLHIRS